MRTAGWCAALTSLLGWCGAATAQLPSPAKILNDYKPTASQRPFVEYDTPADQAAIDACTNEVVTKNSVVDGKPKAVAIGVQVRDGQGRLLRRILDTIPPEGSDQWSYFQDGFEVYREIDYNGDQKIDEVRWLNQGGTRIGVVQGGKVTSWRRLSAEEASKVLVESIVKGDLDLMNTVVATAEELGDLGMPKGLVDQALAGLATRKPDVEALIKKLAGWNRETVWYRFDGVQPHAIPADAVDGLKEDVELYENPVVFAQPAKGDANLEQMAYLQAPEMIRIGETWKFVGLPRAYDPANPEAITAFDGVRSWVYREAGTLVGEGSNPALEKALTALAELDQKNAGAADLADPKIAVNYHRQRVTLLRDVVAVAPETTRLDYEKEMVNSLAAAYQTGEFPEGLTAIDQFIAAKGPLASYAAFRKIPAEYSLRASKADSVGEAQKAWVADLNGFLDAYPNADEVPEALFQLGNIQELNGDETAARASYERIAKDYPTSEPAPKAVGALKRFDLVGKTLEIKGPGLEGSEVDLAGLRGKMVLVVFGASAGDHFARELPDLVNLYGRYKDKGFDIVGVALDSQKETWAEFVNRKQIPWPTIFETGGMESRLANDLGIISYYYPTMILVDREGKVVDRDIRTALEVEQAIEQPLAKQP